MRTWTLTDVERQLWVDRLEIGPDDAPELGASGWSVGKRRLRGGASDGVDVVRIDNGAFQFTVVPTRGMGLWRGEYRGLAVGWRSPVRGPVHPALVDLGARGGLGWLTGFDEAVVRCGLDANGAPAVDRVPNNQGEPSPVPLTLHGRIANTPASRVEVSVVPGDPPEIVVSGEVLEVGLFLPQLRLRTRIVTALGSATVRIEDRVDNLASTPAELELLYHCNFGPPFLEAGSRLEIPARMVAPRNRRAAEDIATCREYLGPTSGYVEQVYWYEPLGDEARRSVALLHDAAAARGVAVRFDVDELPAFTQWKCTGAEADGYVTGLEPGTDYPNAKPFERAQGRLVVLPGFGSRRASIALEVCPDPETVAAVRGEVAAIQGETPPVVHAAPLPHLSG